MNYEIVAKNIRAELKTYLQTSGLKSLVLGISGGIDSTLMASIAKPVCDDIGIPLIGRSISITSTNKDDERDRARMVGEIFCHSFKEVNLTDVFEVFSSSIDTFEGEDNTNIDGRIRKGNLKSRMRTCILYDIAHRSGGCVLGTDNKTEGAGEGNGLAFFTIGGDGCVDISPLQHLWKTEVYILSKHIAETYGIGTPEYNAIMLSINAKATDGLGVTDGGDLDQIGKNSYDEVDSILIRYHKLTNIIRDDNQEREYQNLSKDLVIKRHLAGIFKDHIPYVFSRDLVLYGA